MFWRSTGVSPSWDPSGIDLRQLTREAPRVRWYRLFAIIQGAWWYGWGDEVPPDGSVVETAARMVQDLGREIDTFLCCEQYYVFISPFIFESYS
jgi:hypothetical protein